MRYDGPPSPEIGILRIAAEAAQPEHERFAGRHAAVHIGADSSTLAGSKPAKHADQVVRFLMPRKRLLQMPLQIVQHLALHRAGSDAVPSVWQFGGNAVILFLYSSMPVVDLVDLRLDPRLAHGLRAPRPPPP